ncbi:transcription-repair coupling factor [Denitrobacterium detoxificans]|uniref:Transcription-repair-coupling factor n=1 Tax=Denitrobacterium detoxificans TaxID=79604 RepID=A0A172RY14_9ACTN|nr:transcription-repair coupling factor [Denitrobacterium detoxificans]ANE22609.1 transcription-repair coupling factor [Denitrobacterium detoxificans]SEO91955.1 transcription-repair coupling factor (superfamily II helicase) [Denitrobacterium detoxificans]
MLIDALVHPLSRCEDMQQFWGKLDSGEDAALGIASSARPFMVASRFARTPQPTLVIIAGEEAADDFARNLGAYVGEERVLRFRERDDYPFGEKEADARKVAQRMESLWSLAHGRECIVVASARSLLRKMPPAGNPFYEPIELSVGAEASAFLRDESATFESFPLALETAGYVNTGDLEGPGTYAVHGGTIDVYPGNLSFPVRIDFFGDEIDEIRRIVPSTGQTIATLEDVRIFPIREYAPSNRAIARARKALLNPAKTNPVLRELLDKLEGGVTDAQSAALLPYLYDRTDTLGAFLDATCLTVLIEPRSLIDDALHAYDDILARAQGSSISPDGLYCPAAKLDFGSNQRCTYQSIMRIGQELDAQLPVKRTDVAGNSEKLFGKLMSLSNADFTVVFSVPNFRARQDMKLALVDRGIPIVETLDADDANVERLKRGVVNVVDVDIPLGLIIPKAKLALVSIADTQGAGSLRTHRRIDITEVTFPFKPGDYVVHSAHGVALFKELVRQEVGGVLRDYLLLEYAEDDKLYVPVEQLDRVTRYVGPEGSSPRLTRLNTSDWSRALNRARKASKKLAFDLVDVYTRRAATQGYRYSADTPWMREMESDFPYQETPDQLAAIADVKADMQSARPMDRLVCGDVGFGKTEVALRAAFKATQDKKQVMVLCPTTILAQQHYTTFKDRFDAYGVTVEVLSRFRTPAQQKAALAGFADGSVQVLVGTHRLLSRDVNPYDLGLVIIDEEQRFGVGHKEQLKNLRESIDVLTLSATPIPRTMQMSLSGVRDMSLILTPPDDRRPVEVHVGEWDPDVVSDAIRREMARGGQVYYVSNRVRGLDDAVARVAQAAPEARVGVAHGKLTKEQLESVMEDFAAAEIDVLVATTIIESGIDNPHTNTLVIEDSQRLGLAQMYQLKGRVGRSNLQAYAYFMFPEHMTLTEEATARLEAINEHQELGSGMRVAMRDLEIRGAGSLLGAEQSGNMSAVGFDLFAQMLAEAVNATREGRVEKSDLLPAALSDITVNVPAHTYIPEEYIPDADERVMLYRKAAFAEEVEVVDELEEQTRKRHPDMPQATINFFMKARVKALANDMHVKTVSVVGGKLNVEPVPKPEGDLWLSLRRAKARYVTQTSKLQVPMKYFALSDDVALLDAVYALLRDLRGQRRA